MSAALTADAVLPTPADCDCQLLTLSARGLSHARRGHTPPLLARGDRSGSRVRNLQWTSVPGVPVRHHAVGPAEVLNGGGCADIRASYCRRCRRLDIASGLGHRCARRATHLANDTGGTRDLWSPVSHAQPIDRTTSVWDWNPSEFSNRFQEFGLPGSAGHPAPARESMDLNRTPQNSGEVGSFRRGTEMADCLGRFPELAHQRGLSQCYCESVTNNCGKTSPGHASVSPLDHRVHLFPRPRFRSFDAPGCQIAADDGAPIFIPVCRCPS